MEKESVILTYEGLKKLEDELQELKVVRRKEVAQKLSLIHISEPTRPY